MTCWELAEETEVPGAYRLGEVEARVLGDVVTGGAAAFVVVGVVGRVVAAVVGMAVVGMAVVGVTAGAALVVAGEVTAAVARCDAP